MFFIGRNRHIDWNVIFLLLGMMIIVGVLRTTGVFEFVAITAALSRGRPFAMMAMLIVTTAGSRPPCSTTSPRCC